MTKLFGHLSKMSFLKLYAHFIGTATNAVTKCLLFLFSWVLILLIILFTQGLFLWKSCQCIYFLTDGINIFQEYFDTFFIGTVLKFFNTQAYLSAVWQEQRLVRRIVLKKKKKVSCYIFRSNLNCAQKQGPEQ